MTETRKVRDFDELSVMKLTKEEAKQILLNTLDIRLEFDDIVSWTLDYEEIENEEVFSKMVSIASNYEFDGGELVKKVKRDKKLKGKKSRYTNIYFYFLEESDAIELVESMKEKIRKF